MLADAALTTLPSLSTSNNHSQNCFPALLLVINNLTADVSVAPVALSVIHIQFPDTGHHNHLFCPNPFSDQSTSSTRTIFTYVAN